MLSRSLGILPLLILFSSPENSGLWSFIVDKFLKFRKSRILVGKRLSHNTEYILPLTHCYFFTLIYHTRLLGLFFIYDSVLRKGAIIYILVLTGCLYCSDESVGLEQGRE